MQGILCSILLGLGLRVHHSDLHLYHAVFMTNQRLDFGFVGHEGSFRWRRICQQSRSLETLVTKRRLSQRCCSTTISPIFNTRWDRDLQNWNKVSGYSIVSLTIWGPEQGTITKYSDPLQYTTLDPNPTKHLPESLWNPQENPQSRLLTIGFRV